MQRNSLLLPGPHPPQCAHWGTFPEGEGLRIIEGIAPATAAERCKNAPDCAMHSQGRDVRGTTLIQPVSRLSLQPVTELNRPAY